MIDSSLSFKILSQMHDSQPILAEQGGQNYMKHLVIAFLHRNLFSSRTIDKITYFHFYMQNIDYR